MGAESLVPNAQKEWYVFSMNDISSETRLVSVEFTYYIYMDVLVT